MNAMHSIFGQLQQLGECAAQRIDALAVRPDREPAGLEARDRARGSYRGVHQIGAVILRLQLSSSGVRRTAASRAPIALEIDLTRWPARELSEELCAVGELGLLAPVSRARERLHRSDRLILARGDDCEIAPVAHYFNHAGQPPHRLGLD